MSANGVTVGGHPIYIRRGKMILSDFEHIKKSEREHRRRLRSEQVREQSKALSKRILERTRQIEREQYTRLQQDCHTEMKRARDRRLMELHRKYEEDIENIGYAHENALKQPDIQEIRRIEEEKNKALAKSRGLDAMQQLQESKETLSSQVKQRQRLLDVRNVENVRSSLVAQLPKKLFKVKDDNSTEILEQRQVSKSPLKRRMKCVVSKKSPVKKLKETKVYRKTPHKSMCNKDLKTPKETSKETPKQIPISMATSTEKSKDSPNKVSNCFKTLPDSLKDEDKLKFYESDDNEPRKTVPVTSFSSSKPEIVMGHNKESFSSTTSDLSNNCTTSSSSISDDSSYFSDTAYKSSTIKKAPLPHLSPVSSKVDLYDYKTRQKNSYERPPGLVEKMNIKNQQSAEDLAQEVIQLENKKLENIANQKKNSEQRTQDAVLREKIRRDYQALLKNLDLLSKEERKLKANQVSEPTHQQIQNPSKNIEDNAQRQKKMDRVFQNILRSSQEPLTSQCKVERPITITPQNYIHSNSAPTSSWTAPPYIDEQRVEESYSEDDDFTHKIKISELLLKIERLKKKLLQEYGANLPDDIFNFSVKSLFNQSSSINQHQINNCLPKSADSEIQVLNMSDCNESIKPVRKVFTQNKRTGNIKNSVKKVSKQSSENSIATRDQQVQVELEQTQIKEDVVKKPLESTVTIITPNSDTSTNLCSDSSVSTDLFVGVNKNEITVVPKSRENSVRISTNTSSSSAKSKFISNEDTPVKISFEQKTGGTSFEVAGVLIDTNNKKITILPRKKKSILNITSSSKAHSLPSSRDNSPSQKVSKSAPTSQQSSPKKPTSKLHKVNPKKCSVTRKINSKNSTNSHQSKKVETKKVETKKIDTKEQNNNNKTQKTSTKKQEHSIPESSMEDQGYRSQYTQVSIDTSTESSHLNYESKTTSKTETNRLFRSFRTLMSKQIMTKLQDSDASTTYASPPAPIPGSMLKTLIRTSPILELLNNSNIDLMNGQVSPVSSPETPSPRTMRIPSNVKNSTKISKSLKFTSLIGRHMKMDSNEVPKSNCINRITSNNKLLHETKPSSQNYLCTCQMSTCKLFHDKSQSIQLIDLKNCPEILEKYEDLKNNCTERIASLTDSIQKLRNEQKGFELSVTTNEDSNPTNKIKMNGPLLTSSEMNNQLVNSIETIHAQLKKKLMESRNIISGEGIKLAISPVSDSHAEKSPSISIDLSKSSLSSDGANDDVLKTKNTAMTQFDVRPKPKIVSDERVNIKLNHLNIDQRSRNVAKIDKDCKTTVTTTAAKVEKPETALNAPDQNEDIVEILSKEILEQSKNIKKLVSADTLKDSDDSIFKLSNAIEKDNKESDKNMNSKTETNHSTNSDINASDFVPMLGDIPKFSRTLAKNTTNARTRPPVTLISGPYRTEIASPVHELSTIVEFDTPDTANKSQVSNKSLSNKCRKKLPLKEVPTQLTATSSKATDVKLPKCKPSVHVAPLPAYRSPKRSLNLSNRSTSKNIDKSPRKFAEKSLDSLKNKKALKSEIKNDSSDSLHTLPDVHIDQLQYSHDNGDGNTEFHVSEISELQSLPEENIDRLLISDLHEESKSQSITTGNKHGDKCEIVLSDSSSFSGLSGVSEITTSPNSDLNLFKYPSSPEEMELALKKWGLKKWGWALQTLKKTREASALGSSSSSDVTPVNPAARLVSPVKKQHDSTPHDFPVISDVSSISIKHANKSTEKSVLVKGRTSTPNRFSNSNTDDTISTLESFSSDLNIVVQNQSADITIPNISFSNGKLV